MAKYFNSDYEEVDAFDQKEVDKMIADAVKESKKGLISESDINEKYVPKEKYDELSSKYDKRSDEYKNAKQELEKRGADVAGSKEAMKSAYEKMVDSRIAKIAGDDKEYGEQLKEQFMRLRGEEMTFDDTEIDKSFKEAHALALTSMERDFTPFNASVSSGNAPTVSKTADESKATDGQVDWVLSELGIPKIDNK